jgi:hypothetical protein
VTRRIVRKYSLELTVSGHTTVSKTHVAALRSKPLIKLRQRRPQRASPKHPGPVLAAYVAHLDVTEPQFSPGVQAGGSPRRYGAYQLRLGHFVL